MGFINQPIQLRGNTLYLLRASGVWLWGVQVNYLQIRHLDRIDELIMNRKTEYFNGVLNYFTS